MPIIVRDTAALGLVLALLILLVGARSCLAQEEIDRPDAEGVPTVVRIALVAVDIDEIDSAKQSFAANMAFIAQWTDRRLVHPGRVWRRPLNSVWHPRLQWLNQQRIYYSFLPMVEVSAAGQVTYRQRVWGFFSQPQQLAAFPFDHQQLNVELVATGYTPDQVRLLDLRRNGKPVSGIAKSFSVPDWTVVAWHAQAHAVYLTAETNSQPLAGYSIRIEMRRESLYFVLKVIIPLSLIVAMSWVTFWITPEEIGTNVSVAITSVLTIVAYLFSISESLPKVSYFTRLDAFVMVSLLMVFLVVGQVVIGATLVKAARTPAAQRFDIVCRIMFPVVFVAAVAYTLTNI